MSLAQWKANGWLKPHKTDFQELHNLLELVDRDIEDSNSRGLSLDWQFGIVYNAVLKLCTMMLYDAGFMPEKNLAHFRTLASIEYTLGPKYKEDAIYLDACRIKRNHVEYDYTNVVSRAEVDELKEFVKELRAEVVAKLKVKYPTLDIPIEDPPAAE